MKPYVKPMLYLEKFELNTSMAACIAILNSDTIYKCRADDPYARPDEDSTLFTNGTLGGCTTEPDEFTNCHTNSVSTVNGIVLFGS